MSKTIHGVPEYLTREQLAELLSGFGFDANYLSKLKVVHNGVHAVVFDRDENGRKYPGPDGYARHHVFVPVRDPETAQ